MGQPSCHPAVTPLSPRRHIAVRGSPFPRTLAASPTATPATAWRSGTSCIVIVCCANVGNRIATMVDIAQQVEHLIVVQKVARSNRVIHPSRNPYSRKVCRGFLIALPQPYSPHMCALCVYLPHVRQDAQQKFGIASPNVSRGRDSHTIRASMHS